MNALTGGETVEVLQDRGDMVTGACVGEETSSSLDVLKCIEEFGWCTIKDALAVVDS